MVGDARLRQLLLRQGAGGMRNIEYYTPEATVGQAENHILLPVDVVLPDTHRGPELWPAIRGRFERGHDDDLLLGRLVGLEAIISRRHVRIGIVQPEEVFLVEPSGNVFECHSPLFAG